jgi:putative pyruvate formate lyase activating enzyme
MSKAQPPQSESIPRQTDIVIDPDGKVHISFLWDELADCVDALRGKPRSQSVQSQLSESTPVKQLQPAAPDADFLDFLDSETPPKSEYRSCMLCPKQCGFNRARFSHPRCGGSHLRVSTHGLSHGDEPIIRGVRGSGAIMLGGCSLTCPSCHNPEMVAGGTSVSIRQLVELCYKLRDEGAHNIQLLSPTVHFPNLKIALRALKDFGFSLPIIFKSSGYESTHQISQFKGLVDVWLPDLKYGPNSEWAVKAGVPDYFEITSLAIQKMFEMVGSFVVDDEGNAKSGVLVRHVMAPLPKAERDAISAYLDSLPAGIQTSRCKDFVDLDRKREPSQISGAKDFLK